MGGNGTSLYGRLPSGPHGLDKATVASNQRARLYGGMAHAVAIHGYEATSVAEVIKLAGVSRTTFYELFANKHDCFLAAYETMAYRMIKNIHGSYRCWGGDWLRALSGGFDALRAELIRETSAARMVIFEAPPAGPEAIARSRKVRTVFEQILSQSLVNSPAGPAVTSTLVKAITGGIRNVLHPRLYPGNLVEIDAATEELAVFTLAYHAPEVEVGRPVGRCAPDRCYSQLAAHRAGIGHGGMAARALAAVAAMPAGHRHAVLERFEELAEHGAREPGWVYEAAPQWPSEVGESIRTLTRFIASNPSFGRMGFPEISRSGTEIGARAHQLFGEFRALLARGRGLCGQPRSAIVCEAVAAAIWESIHHQASLGRTHSFAELSDELTYIALVPFIGSLEARRILTGRLSSTREVQSAVA